MGGRHPRRAALDHSHGPELITLRGLVLAELEWLAVAASAAATGYAIAVYAYDWARRRTLPHPVSWLIWDLVYAVLVTALWPRGARWSLMPLALILAGNLVITVLAVKRGTGHLGTGEKSLIACCTLALGAWCLAAAVAASHAPAVQYLWAGSWVLMGAGIPAVALLGEWARKGTGRREKIGTAAADAGAVLTLGIAGLAAFQVYTGLRVPGEPAAIGEAFMPKPPLAGSIPGSATRRERLRAARTDRPSLPPGLPLPSASPPASPTRKPYPSRPASRPRPSPSPSRTRTPSPSQTSPRPTVSPGQPPTGTPTPRPSATPTPGYPSPTATPSPDAVPPSQHRPG